MSNIATSLRMHIVDGYGYGAVATCLLVSATVGLYALQRPLWAKCPLERSTVQRHGLSIHKPQILGCNVSHHRLFPEHHGFTYSYLTVGIPARSPRSSWLLSVDATKSWRRGWLHVTAEDHLNRGSEGMTLSEHLDSYSRQAGLDLAAFPHVYLLTSARFLKLRL